MPTITSRLSGISPVSCTPPRLCNELSVTHEIEDYYIDVGQVRFRGTRARIGFRVGNPSDIHKYVFVQFLRGGMFLTTRDVRGMPKKLFNFVKPQNAGLATFYFPEWIVDSIDPDPVYWSVPGVPRTDRYLVAVEGHNPWTNWRTYGNVTAPVRELYIIDRPSLAFRGERGWVNVALEFRTCLFFSDDVPITIPEDSSTLLSRALHCVDWRSVYVFDHQTGRWRSDCSLEGILRKDAPINRKDHICTPA